MTHTIEVRHEGGIVYLDGHGMTAAEADSLARLLQAGASDARGWAIWRQKDAEGAAERARLEATGLTHIVSARGGYLARREGLPVVVDAYGERPARRPWQLGDGPPLEARVYGGRKWRPLSEFWPHEYVGAYRVKP